MKKNDKVQHLRSDPQLRFNEFKEEYRNTNLGNITKRVISGRTPNKNDSTIWGQDIPWITSGDIHKKYIWNGDLFLNENTIDKVGITVIPKHSVLIGTAGQGKTRCTVGTNERKLCTNDAMLSMIPKDDVYYLYLLFLLESKYQQLRLLTPQETKTRLSTNNLKLFKINLPVLDEQQKVADFIYKVERKILLLEEKLQHLKLFKRGYKNKLISKNDKTNSIQVKVGEILTEVSEKTHKNNEYEVLSSTKTGLYKQSEYFNTEVASKNNIGYKILRKGQFVMSPQNAWMGNFSINNKFEVGIVSPSYKVFDISSIYSNILINEFTNTHRFKYDVMCSSEQGASVVRRNLNIEDFLNIKIRLPKNKIDQKHLEGLFLNINCKIDKLEEKIQINKRFKKGLLQQMFV